MTGQLSYVDSLFLPLQSSPLRGYTIDSFSETSTVVPVGRTTPTRREADDEELFRDLFGSEAEPREDGFGGLLPPKTMKTGKSLVPNKAMVWNSGATLTSPFGPTPSTVSSPRQTTHHHSTTAIAAPSLSAPPPRQLVTDLMTSRPSDATDRELSGVPEVDEDDEDDGDSPRKPKAPHRGGFPLSPGLSFKKQSPGSMQQETLRFLEKLDLKTLLAQPRPDVKSFLPQGVPTIPAASNQATYAVDSRVEDDDLSTRNWSTVPGATSVAAGVGRKLSARKEAATNPLVSNSSRLAHMELTYGTTAVEPRKARKETLQRLANPISGHTSTLQALSPGQRKKREAELEDWVPPVASPPLRKLSEKKTRHLIDRLSEAPSLYEAAVAASPLKAKRLVKGAKPLAPMVRLKSNQEEDGGINMKAKLTKPSSGRPQASGRGMDERKLMLKQKLAARSAAEGSVPSANAGLGATFLTQHEETEAKLATRTSKSLVPRPPAGRRLNKFDGSHIAKRPVIPPSVRPRASSSSTAAATPTARTRGVQRPTIASGVKLRLDDANSRSRQQQKPSRSLGKTQTLKSRTSTREMPLKASTPTPSRPKRTTSMPSSSGATALLLGGLQASDAGQKTPLKSTGRLQGRATTQSMGEDKRKSLTAKETSGPEATTSSPVKTSLPHIRKPTANAPRRSPAPTARRIHHVRA